jgi:hypothetical protein
MLLILQGFIDITAIRLPKQTVKKRVAIVNFIVYTDPQ